MHNDIPVLLNIIQQILNSLLLELHSEEENPRHSADEMDHYINTRREQIQFLRATRETIETKLVRYS